MAHQAGQVFQIARIGELVQIEHCLVVDPQPVEYEICADEAGAAGDQYHDDSLFKSQKSQNQKLQGLH